MIKYFSQLAMDDVSAVGVRLTDEASASIERMYAHCSKEYNGLRDRSFYVQRLSVLCLFWFTTFQRLEEFA